MEKKDIRAIEGFNRVDQEKTRNIRLKPESFGNTKNGYFKLLRELEKEKEILLTKNYKTDSNSRLSERSRKDIEKRTMAIAKLEQEIKFLNGEFVPEDFVFHRAIKLKENMFKNLTFNSQNAYSVGLDKYDAIFSDKKEEAFESAAPTVEPEKVGFEVVGTAATPEEYEEVVVENEEAVEQADHEAIYDSTSGEFVKDTEDVQDAEFENSLDNIIRENQRRIAEDVQSIIEEKDKDKAADSIDVASEEIDREQIKDAVEDMFKSVDLDAEDTNKDIFGGMDEEIAALKNEDAQAVIGKDDIQDSIDGEMSGISLDDEHAIDAGDIESAIDEAMAGVQTEPEIDYEGIKAELDEAMANIRVSKSGTAAKLDKFDENGQVKENETEEVVEEKKYDYKPMTDEEIARARENIEFDKYEDLYHNVKHEEETEDKETFSLIVPEVKFDDIFKPIENVNNYGNVQSPTINFETIEKVNDNAERELPMVVPERVETTQNEKEVEAVNEDTDIVTNEEDLHFDYSTATADEVNKGFDQASSLGEFAELRRRAEELKEKQRKSREDREAAEKAAEEAARRAQEIKEAALAKQRDYEKRLEKLRLYTEALAEDVEFNANKAELAKNDAKCNERFVEAQEEKAKNIDNMINEIDSIIGSEATNVRRVK